MLNKLNIFDLDLWFQVDSVEQPIKRNSVGPWRVSHCWTSSSATHLDDSFVVFKHIQQSFAPRFASTAFGWSFCHGLCACFLVPELPHDSTEFSTLQMLLWFGPSYLDWVEAKLHIDTCSIPLVRVSGKKDTELSPRRLSSILVAHLVNHATWFFTEDHITLFFKSLRMDFCAWSNLQKLLQLFVDFISSVLRLSRWHLDVLLPLGDRFCRTHTSITTSHKPRASNPSIRSWASNEIISDPVELWDTDVCFLHIQLTGTNAPLPKKIHKTAPEVDFESSRSPTKSECWNNPCLQCWAALPTWQHCRNSFVWWIVWNQSCQSSVACLSPFCHRSCKFVDRPQSVWSPNSC